MRTVRIATRKSRLALWQAEHVAAAIMQHCPSLNVELLPMSTKGDEILDRSLAKIGGKGLFVKELERALLSNEADLAVHSMKDVPADMPAGLGIVAIMQREDPRDALVSDQVDEISGTIKEVQWTNPHIWIQVMVENSDGVATEWSVEWGSPNTLSCRIRMSTSSLGRASLSSS